MLANDNFYEKHISFVSEYPRGCNDLENQTKLIGANIADEAWFSNMQRALKRTPFQDLKNEIVRW